MRHFRGRDLQTSRCGGQETYVPEGYLVEHAPWDLEKILAGQVVDVLDAHSARRSRRSRDAGGSA